MSISYNSLEELFLYKTINFRSGKRIVPAATPWVAFAHSLKGEPQSFEGTVLAKGFDTILTAGRCKPAFGTNGRADHILIKSYQGYKGPAKNLLEQLHESVVSVVRVQDPLFQI
jgi:hypothetical protein